MRRFPAEVGLALALCASWARAQGTEGLESLLERPVVSTPSKGAESADVAPAVSSVITGEDMRRYGLRSLDEALNFLSLGVVATNPQHAVEVGSRGVLLTSDYGNHMLLLVDGHALNEPWNGTAYFERGSLIPLELIDRIEVLLGPGSVLYGSQAMFGVINIVTKRARDFSGVHVLAEGELSVPNARGGGLRAPGSAGFAADLGTSYRVGLGAGLEFKLFQRPAELVAQLEYYRELAPAHELGPQLYGDDSVTGLPKDFGPRTPKGVWGGRVREAGFSEVPAFYGVLRLDDTELALRAGMYRRGVPYQDAIVANEGLFDDASAFERDRAINLELRTRAALSRATSLSLRAYGDYNDYQWHSPNAAAEDCPEDTSDGCVRDLFGTGLTAGAEARLAFTASGAARPRSLFGLELRATHVDSDLQVADGATGSLSAAENDYVQTRLPLAAYVEQGLTPLRWLDLNAGVRLDYVSDYAARLSPRGALGVTPWESARLKLIYSEAFRSPNSYERFYADPNFEVAAPDLKAERERSFEVFFEQRMGAHRIGFGVFRSYWFDMVQNVLLSEEELAAATLRGDIAVGTEEAYTYRNAGQIDSYGFNGGVDGLALDRRLAYGLNVTGAYTRIDLSDGSTPLPPTAGPQYFGNARLAYRLGSPGTAPWLAVAANYQARRPAASAFESGYSPAPDAPAQLELKTTLSGQLSSIPGLSYRVSCGYAFQRSGPYLIGPHQYAPESGGAPELSPLKRLYGFAGLAYSFGAASR